MYGSKTSNPPPATTISMCNIQKDFLFYRFFLLVLLAACCVYANPVLYVDVVQPGLNVVDEEV